MNKFSTRLLILIVFISNITNADTLEEVLQRGFLRCGVTDSGPGFSIVNDKGERAGFEIDHCKTIAAAVFGELKLEYVLVTPQTAFTLLQSGGIDIFPAGATLSFSRDTRMGLDFAGVYFYDGQGFMVRKDRNVEKVVDLQRATICITQGTTLEQNIADYFGSHDLEYKVVTFAGVEKAMQAYEQDRCDAMTMQRAALAARSAGMHNRGEHMILSEMISKEPQGALVRQDDPKWRDIAFWAFNARLAAEELGINQANVEQMRKNSSNAEVRRLLGVYGDYGLSLGLSNTWAYSIIRLVGNYDDIWKRNLSVVGLERGPNALWRDGGVMIALPFR
ncbi:MAG: general L-amino acid transport system substrate-binding protein [Gammaproteobacteria bacterium]|jgi:general L-amino acid transport system substrate-binding protein